MAVTPTTPDACKLPDATETFELRLVELLGHQVLLHDLLSPYEIARLFYMAGYQDGLTVDLT